MFEDCQACVWCSPGGAGTPFGAPVYYRCHGNLEVQLTVRRLITAGILGLALVLAAPAAAKEFRPGDLRLCTAAACVTVRDQETLDQLSSFVYTGRPPRTAPAPRLGVPYYRLRFSNGYTAGIVATTRLDRWLSYGVYLERFERAQWYRVPPRTARALRALTSDLKPLRPTRDAVRRSR